MDEFIGIVTRYSCIKPTAQAAREAQLNGSFDLLKKKCPNVYARLTHLLFQDLTSPFPQTEASKRAISDYERIVAARNGDYDDYCEMVMYNEMVQEFGYPYEGGSS